jgi:TonB family protein
MALDGWEYSPDGRQVLFAESVVFRLRHLVIEGFTSLPRRGLEVGGILIGSEQGCDLQIDDFQEAPCEHQYGPSYAMNGSDRENLTELLAQPHQGTGRVIGFFQSFTGREPLIEQADEILFGEQFPCGDFLFLRLQPLSVWKCLASSRFFRDGVLQPEIEGSIFVFGPGIPAFTQPAGADESPAAEGPSPTMSEEAPDPPPATPGDKPTPGPKVLPSWEPAAPRVAVSGSRTLPAPALAGLAALLGAAGMYVVKSRPATAPPVQSQWAELHLDARPFAGKLLVTWDSAAAGSLQDVGGILKIADAGSDRNIPLGRSQIAAGRYEYTPARSDVAVRLTVTEKGRPVASEGVRLATIPAQAPAVPPSPRQQADQANAHVAPEVAHEVYPGIPEGIRSRLTGEVMIPVEVNVSETGRVLSARASRRSGDPVARYLTDQAIKAAHAWRFKPARTGEGRPIASITTVRFVFRP